MRVVQNLHRIAAIVALVAMVLAIPFRAECLMADATPASHAAPPCHRHHGTSTGGNTMSCCHHDAFVAQTQVRPIMALPVSFLPRFIVGGYELDSRPLRIGVEPSPPLIHPLILRI